MKGSIIVKTNFEGIHCHPKATGDVDFLRQPHRHNFYVKVKIGLKEEETELEPTVVKREINSFLYSKPFTVQYSCVQMAQEILGVIERSFGPRPISVCVYEDNENGGEINNGY